ncbi:RecBCD enzyme subunit RecC [compost metagenome]
MLEALLSARDQLYVSWVGRSIRDNSERPASVLIGQLRDHLAGGWRLAAAKQRDKLDAGEQLLHALTVEHPLQPFSARYFHKGSSLFSYAREWRTLHLPVEEQTKAEDDLPPYSSDDALSLTLLQDFLRHPVRHFFSQRLKVFFEAVQAPLADEEPFVLDALQRYSLSESLLAAALATPDDVNQALGAQARRLQGCGMLPLAGFGQCLQAELIEPLPDLLQRHQQLLRLWPTALDSALPIRFEYRQLKLEGWLGRVYQRDDQSLLSITTLPNGISSGRSLKWQRLTSTWVMHLAACAVGLPLHSAVVATDITLLLAPIEQARAADMLGDLLLARQAGMSSPLPVATKTAFAWLAQSDPAKALAAAAKAYEGDGQNSFGERSESTALARQFSDFAALTASEEFEGWCEALYRPMFDAPWQTLGNEEDAQ